MLCPGNRIKLVAEGLAGNPSMTRNTEAHTEQSFLMLLCEGGLQYVKVTRVHKKNVELMFIDVCNVFFVPLCVLVCAYA